MDDRALKVMYPLPNCLMSFAGPDTAGYALARAIMGTSTLESKEDLQDFLNSCARYHRSGLTALFGLYDRVAQRPRLLKWASQEPNAIEENAYLYCGSGSGHLGEGARDFALELTHLPAQTTQKAAALSGYLNQKLFHATGKRLATCGVGGLFYSIALEQLGLLVQEDTAIIRAEIIEGRKLVSLYVIKVAYRKGILFINSSVSQERKAYINSYNCSKEAMESNEALRRCGKQGLEGLGIDFEDLWDLANVRNIEVHFSHDNVPSLMLTCDPGEYLTLGATRTQPIISQKLWNRIRDCIKNARQ